jgi:hypothetical protein
LRLAQQKTRSDNGAVAERTDGSVHDSADQLSLPARSPFLEHKAQLRAAILAAFGKPSVLDALSALNHGRVSSYSPMFGAPMNSAPLRYQPSPHGLHQTIRVRMLTE